MGLEVYGHAQAFSAVMNHPNLVATAAQSSSQKTSKTRVIVGHQNADGAATLKRPRHNSKNLYRGHSCLRPPFDLQAMRKCPDAILVTVGNRSGCW